MKKLSLSLSLVIFSLLLFAQTPNQFKYQAILRNADGTIMAEESVTIDISILKSDLSTSVFDETHNVTTTTQGLINLNIGSVEDLSNVDWTLDEYFIEISVNGTIIGTSQLLSVPYALHSKTVESVTETDPIYTAWNKSYDDLINTPNIIDSIYTVFDTTTQFVRTEVDDDVTNEIQNLNSVLSQGTDAGNNSILNVSQQGIGTATPNASAALEINSTTQGFLPPSMTIVQREAIINPEPGLQIFNTTVAKPNYYDGTEWKNFDGTSARLAIGDFYKGGVIIYVDETGLHGIVCAVSDESTGIDWGCYGTDIAAIPNKTTAENDPTEDGLAFSNAIVSACGTATAAGVCREKTTGGYTNWYLPTQYELNLMFENKLTIDATAVANDGIALFLGGYWSSTEYDNNNAWYQIFLTGGHYNNDKDYSRYWVRAVRAF